LAQESGPTGELARGFVIVASVSALASKLVD